MALIFWAFAIIAVGSALAVVLLPNVFRAGLFLVLAFFAIAGLFITLGADFLAAVQVLIYVGAIGVLLLLAIMLTREVHRGSPANRQWLVAVVLGAVLFLALTAAVVSSPWPSKPLPSPEPVTARLGASLFDAKTGFLLPFEIAALLLLAAVIGAIVLVREKEK